jgi:hypothetical protein
METDFEKLRHACMHETHGDRIESVCRISGMVKNAECCEENCPLKKALPGQAVIQRQCQWSWLEFEGKFSWATNCMHLHNFDNDEDHKPCEDGFDTCPYCAREIIVR